MMEPTSPELEVAPLPEPTAPPWGEDGGAASEEGASTPADGSPTVADTAAIVEMLTGAVQVPFALVALVRGEHWQLTDPEAGRIARPLARALPPAWLMSRLLMASPWAVVATATYQAVAARLATDQAIRAAVPPPQEVPDRDTRTGRFVPSGGDGADNGDRPPDAAGIGAVGVANPSEFEGAGLGLGGPVRSSGGRTGRGRGNPGDTTPPPTN